MRGQSLGRGLVVGVLSLAGCMGHGVAPDPFPSTAGPIDPERISRFEAATRYSDEHFGRAVLVIEGDRVIWERYRRGLHQDEPKQIFSGTKTFLCAAAVAAEVDGLLDLDQPASRWIGEWRDDPVRSTITGRQLLQQTSGLDSVFPRLAFDALLPFSLVADKQAWAIAQPSVSPPGERFEYGCVHMLAFAELFERAAGEPVLDYLERRIFDPIGLDHGRWKHDRSGNTMFSVGARISARDWARFGLLLRDDGVWKGEAVLPPGALAACTQGSEANPAYGLAMWLNQPMDPALVSRLPGTFGSFPPEGPLLPGGPDDLVGALGWRNNRMYVSPSRDLVIVRNARLLGDYRDSEFLALLLGGS